MTKEFRGGPFADGRQSEIRSLVVHMAGDGRTSIGWYEQTSYGVFEWRDAWWVSETKGA